MPPSEPDSSPELPETLGSFRVTGLLGEGGSAVVYAVDWNGEEAALKVPRERELSPKEQERFLEEAKMLERVRHRAVVEVLDSGRLPDGQPYLLMRRYDGETLGDRIARGGALPMEQALHLFGELSSAVESLHEAGLLHRDLKPENVLLVDAGRAVKLLDFGIAKDMDAPASTTTQAGIARGTPATMAPERFFGAPASTSTDVYELSVVLYVMLVGRLPWPEVTNPQTRLNPLTPLEAGAVIPEALSDIMMRALSTRPERRPSSIAELAEGVREASQNAANLGGRVTAATVTSVPPPALSLHKSEEAQVIESRREPRRAQSGWFVGAAVGVLALVGIGIAGVVALRSEAPASTMSAAATPSTLEPQAGRPAAVPVPPASSEPEPSAEAPHVAPAPSAASTVHGVRPSGSAAPKPSGSAEKPAPPPKGGKPKGAPCTRSSECASMVCAAETCQ